MSRLYLSPPDVGEEERRLLLDAFDSNWVAPLGPHVDAFEAEVAALVGVGHAVALSSGTAGLHLALSLLGVGPGDEVLVPTFTFVASANTVRYLGARPVLVDCRADTWQVDPDLVEEQLERRAAAGRLPAAVMAVDLYGQVAACDRLEALCRRYEIPLVEDAAEALGATRGAAAAGSFGQAAVISFNGNKIATTGGGGMLLTDSAELAASARHLATQAREAAVHYQHVHLGYNYRLSNLLAAVGRGQLRRLGQLVARRREINRRYRRALADLPGVAFMPEDPAGTANCWLTCITVDPAEFGAGREDVRLRLEAEDIESRPTWKPLHLQPLYADADRVGGAVAAGIFEVGLCLPSGSAMTDEDVDRVAGLVRDSAGRPAARRGGGAA